MTNDNRMNDKTVIIIDEKPDVIPGQPEGEVPVITIEDSGSAQTAQPAKMRRGRSSVGWRQHNLGFKVVYFVKGHGHTQYRVAGHLYPAFYRFGCRCPLKFFQIL